MYIKSVCLYIERYTYAYICWHVWMHIHIYPNYENTYTKEKYCKEYKIRQFLRGDIADYF